MNQQDIIDMAVQAGFDDITPWLDQEKIKQGTAEEAQRWLDKMVKFAALVGYRVYEVEQEQCADKVVAEGVAEYERGLKDGAVLERKKSINIKSALEELVDQNDNGICGVSGACWSRARAALADTGEAKP